MLGCDIGGTFTDFVYLDGGDICSFKLPSTPKKPEMAIAKGLASLLTPPSTITHGTTLATNAVLERKGHRTALLTTGGFSDVLFIGSQKRSALYELEPSKPEPLIPRHMCYGIPERLDSRGEVILPLDREAVHEVARKLKNKGVRSIAVSFLFSYLNPVHEREAKDILEGTHDWKVSISSEVLPLFREYPRTSTTLLDSYIGPLISSYLKRLKMVLHCAGDPGLYIMQSNGGVVVPDIMEKRPVTSILSGPAGGVAAAEHLATLIDIGDMLTLDMGGTSTDVSCLLGGKPDVFSMRDIQGLPVAVPMVDIEIVGAGGGSIAYVDRGGVLKVGPVSAGASPGPVCYGKGGKKFTITDADLLCGYLSPENFLGGKMLLHPDRAEVAARTLANELGLPMSVLLTGVQKVVHAEMVRALSRVSIERGVDPRDMTLLAFGGAGPVHAVYVAKDLGITKIVVPPSPGTFSALGMLVSPVRLTYSQSVLRTNVTSHEEIQGTIEGVLEDFMTRAREEVSLQGLPWEDVILEPTLALRYRGQSFELRVPYENSLSRAFGSFTTLHGSLYGFTMDHVSQGDPSGIEVVDVSLVISVKRKGSPLMKIKGQRSTTGPSRRQVIFQEGEHECSIFHREALRTGHAGYGPAIIEEGQSTTVVPPGCSFRIDEIGCIEIRWDIT